MAYTKTFGATAYLTFNGEQIALSAKDLTNPQFVYHAESFYTAPSFGSLEDLIGAVVEKLGDIGTNINVADITSEIKKLSSIPVLGALLQGQIVITDFVIDKPNNTYEFGFGMRFTDSSAAHSIGPVSLDGVAFLVKLVQTGSTVESTITSKNSKALKN